MKDNQEHMNDGEIAKEVNGFFSCTFTVENLTNVPIANVAQEDSIDNINVRSSDVAKQLKKLKVCKSRRPDNIFLIFSRK